MADTTDLYLVIFVLDNPDECPAILDAWEEAGVTGVTIMESTGLGRFRRTWQRDDVPLLPSLHEFFQSEEIRHRTLFSVVKGEATVDALLKAAEKIVGNLEGEDTGVFFVIPVLRAHGLGLVK
jgi:nitrogen regulatory protein P-II 1